MEAPIKSEVFCSSFMHFWFAFGGAICQVINAECSILCFVFHADNSFLACKLAINQLVEQRHRLNLRYFAHLLCIFCLPLVELFARLLMLSVRWCFTCFVSLLCFCALLRFFALFFMQAILSSLASWLLISQWNGGTA